MSYLLPVLLGGLAVFICVLGLRLSKQVFFLSLPFVLAFGLQALILVVFPVYHQPIKAKAVQGDSQGAQRGDLHEASWADWKKAPIQNRLATATDYLKTFREQGLFVARIRGLDEYRPWAAALVNCLEWEYAQKNGPQPKAVARECLSQEKIQRFFRP